MTELAKRTWIEAGELLTPETVAIVPIGSTEPHGPHLPLDTDVTIAVAQSRRAVELLEQRGVHAVLVPALPYGLTNYTEGFSGRISLRPGTLWALLEDVVTSLEQLGVRQVVFSNGHLEPEHVAVLRGVVLDHSERGKLQAQVVFPDNTRRRWAATLGEEFQSGDCHAGRYETSIALRADAPSVRTDELRELPEVRIDLIDKMRSGVRSFREAGADRAYCGDPAHATAEEGADLIDRLGQMIATTVLETWPELAAK